MGETKVLTEENSLGALPKKSEFPKLKAAKQPQEKGAGSETSTAQTAAKIPLYFWLSLLMLIAQLMLFLMTLSFSRQF